MVSWPHESAARYIDRTLSQIIMRRILLAIAVAYSSRLSAQGAGRPIKGITCDAGEGQRIHIHQHLAIFDHGKAVDIPAFIGIPQMARCIYWLHTHTPDGIIHIEAPVDRSFTLGDFFAVWGKSISRTEVAGFTPKKGESIHVWVDGKEFKGDPATIPLKPHTDVAIQVGPPNKKPALFTAWNGL